MLFQVKFVQKGVGLKIVLTIYLEIIQGNIVP